MLKRNPEQQDIFVQTDSQLLDLIDLQIWLLNQFGPGDLAVDHIGQRSVAGFFCME